MKDPYDFDEHCKKRYPGWADLSEQKQLEIITLELCCPAGWWAMTEEEKRAEIERINADLEDYE